MPRPKILDVNEGIGEALFYPYNVLVNKCSGSCNTLDNPMAKFARKFLWHESYGTKVASVYVN